MVLMKDILLFTSGILHDFLADTLVVLYCIEAISQSYVAERQFRKPYCCERVFS